MLESRDRSSVSVGHPAQLGDLAGVDRDQAARLGVAHRVGPHVRDRDLRDRATPTPSRRDRGSSRRRRAPSDGPSRARPSRASPRPCVPTASAPLRARCASSAPRARIADSDRSSRASRSSRCASVAAASYAGRNDGQMNPPSCDAARSMPRLLRDFHEVRGRQLRPDDGRAVPLGDALGFAAHRHRQRDVRVRMGRAHELDDQRAAPGRQ